MTALHPSAWRPSTAEPSTKPGAIEGVVDSYTVCPAVPISLPNHVPEIPNAQHHVLGSVSTQLRKLMLEEGLTGNFQQHFRNSLCNWS